MPRAVHIIPLGRASDISAPSQTLPGGATGTRRRLRMALWPAGALSDQELCV